VFLTISFVFALIPKRRKIPKYYFFSLSEEQAIMNRCTDSLLNFLNETRFSFGAELKNSLIEVRNLKYIWFGRKISVTYDSALYLLFRCIKRKKLLRIYKYTFKKTFSQYMDSTSILDWKRNVFDLYIWQESFKDSSGDTYLFTTQSSETKLPPAFMFPNSTNIKKVMFWYGTNTEPIEIASSIKKRHSNADQLNHFVNQHYVWDQFQSEILAMKGIVNVEVKGSILFIPRELKKISFGTPSLIYFDVTPDARSIPPYTVEFCISTLLGIVSVCDEITRQTNIKINVFVKPKRSYNKNASKKYTNLLKQMQIQEKLKILDSKSNIYGLISNINLTLGIVFTSPVLVAKELDKPGAFVALNGENFSETYNEMKVISNVTQLKSIILSTLELNR
jgi:hypothetical protein